MNRDERDAHVAEHLAGLTGPIKAAAERANRMAMSLERRAMLDHEDTGHTHATIYMSGDIADLTIVLSSDAQSIPAFDWLFAMFAGLVGAEVTLMMTEVKTVRHTDFGGRPTSLNEALRRVAAVQHASDDDPLRAVVVTGIGWWSLHALPDGEATGDCSVLIPSVDDDGVVSWTWVEEGPMILVPMQQRAADVALRSRQAYGWMSPASRRRLLKGFLSGDGNLWWASVTRHKPGSLVAS